MGNMHVATLTESSQDLALNLYQEFGANTLDIENHAK